MTNEVCNGSILWRFGSATKAKQFDRHNSLIGIPFDVSLAVMH